MAQDRILGKDMIIFIEDLTTPGTWYPIYCAKTCDINLSSTMLQVTDSTSGVFYDGMPDQITGTMSGTGLVQINKDRQIFTAIEYILTRQKIKVRYSVTATTTVAPNVTVKRIESSGYFTQVGLNGAHTDVGQHNFTIQLIGNIEITL